MRIDNQSFQHLYYQDRTKRAFVYEGSEQNDQNDEEQKQEDYGYGGYKKGHTDVK